MGKGSEMMEKYKELVQEQGFRVDIKNGYCSKFLETHENCSGCESEEGCGRYCTLLMLTTTALVYKPTSYEDFKKMDKDIKEKMEKVLDRNLTLKEVRALVA